MESSMLPDRPDESRIAGRRNREPQVRGHSPTSIFLVWGIVNIQYRNFSHFLPLHTHTTVLAIASRYY